MKRRCLILAALKNDRDSAGWRRGGFTLVELLMAMLVSSILMAALYGVYAAHTRSYTTQNVAAGVQQAVRTGIDFMAEDIMMAGFDPQGTAGAAIEVIGSTTIRVTLDRNMDGSINDSDSERITYTWSGTGMPLNQILYEGQGVGVEDTQAFIDNVEALAFTYLDAGDLQTTVIEGIRSVEISMTVKEPAGRAGEVERKYTTKIRCRNLGL